jgi:hypothetical protein
VLGGTPRSTVSLLLSSLDYGLWVQNAQPPTGKQPNNRQEDHWWYGWAHSQGDKGCCVWRERGGLTTVKKKRLMGVNWNETANEY